MPLSASKRELLTQKIVFNHEILTHRVVARSFKVEARQARALLREFHESSDGRTHATYIVTGYVKPDEPIPLDGPPAFVPADGVSSSIETDASPQVNGNGTAHPTSEADVVMEGTAGHPQPAKYATELNILPQEDPEDIHCVALIPEDELEARLGRFSRILSSEIYSLEASKLPDLVLLTDANSRILSEPELAQIDGSVVGTIAHYREKPKRTGKSSKASTSASTSAAGKKGNTSQPDLKRKASSTTDLKESKTASTSKATSAGSSKAGSPAAGDSKKSKGALGSMFAKGEEKNKASAAAAATEKEKKEAAGKGKKKQDEEETDKMEVDKKDDDDEFGDLMMDDDDLMAEIDGLDNGKVSTGQKGKKPAAADTTGKSKASTSKSADGKVRKTRTITKTIHTTNAKGYKVATQVETEEEYSESDEDDGGAKEVTSAAGSTSKMKRSDSSTSNSKEKKKESTPSTSNAAASNAKKPAASSSNAKGGAKPGEQSSLKNFFGKPKASKK